MSLVPSKARKLLAVSTAILIAYTCLGFFVCPLLFRSATAWSLSRFLGRAVTIERMRFNPYSLRLEYGGFRIAERAGGDFFYARRIGFAIDPLALAFRRSLTSGDIAVVGARMSLTRSAQGRLNVEDLLDLTYPSFASVHIGSLRLVDVSLDYIRQTNTGTSLAKTRSLSAKWAELVVSNVNYTMSPRLLSLASTELREAQLAFGGMSMDRIDARLGPYSSSGDRLARFSASADIAGGGKLQLLGELDPLDPRREARLRMFLQNMDLAATIPYAIPGLGFEIESGTLRLDLRISVLRGSLSARSSVVIDHLKLGKRSPGLALPGIFPRMAIALLTDPHGTIAFELPVEGSLAAPSYNLAKALLQSSDEPFKKGTPNSFAAIGRGAELGIQKFLTGSATLLPAESPKLDAILLGMRRLPRLSLDIEGDVDAAKDSGDLQALAAARAASVRDYLLRAGSLEPGRIFIVEDSPENMPRAGSRATLKLNEEYRGPLGSQASALNP